MNDQGSIYQALVEQSPVAIAVHEIIRDDQGVPVDYRFLAANTAFGKHTGLDSARIIGRTVREILPGIEETDYISRYGNVVDSGSPLNFESYSNPLKRHYKTDAFKVGDNAFATIFTDITQTKIYERELIQFKLIFDQADIGMAVCDLGGVVTYVNQSMAEMHGYAPAECVGQSIQMFHNEEQRPIAERLFDQVKHGGGFQAVEVPHAHRDGHTFDLLMTIQTLRDSKGMPYAHAATSMDVSELREAEERYRGLFDGSIAAIYVFDANKRFVDTNQAGIEFLGYTREELQRMSMQDADVDSAAVARAHQELLSGGKLVNFEHRLKRKDGAIITVLNNSSPLTDAEGKMIGIISTLIDITAQKQAEAEREQIQGQFVQAQKMESVGRLAGGVAHDYNNMLQVILGSAELALSECNPEEAVRAELEEIRRSAARSQEITRQLLAFARKQAIQPKALDLNATIESTLKMLRRRRGGRRIPSSGPAEIGC